MVTHTSAGLSSVGLLLSREIWKEALQQLSHFCTWDVVTQSRSEEAVAAPLCTALEAFYWWCWVQEGGLIICPWVACLWVRWWAKGALFLWIAKLLFWACNGVTENVILLREWCRPYSRWLPWGGGWRRKKHQGIITAREHCCQAAETVAVQW